MYIVLFLSKSEYMNEPCSDFGLQMDISLSLKIYKKLQRNKKR